MTVFAESRREKRHVLSSYTEYFEGVSARTINSYCCVPITPHERELTKMHCAHKGKSWN